MDHLEAFELNFVLHWLGAWHFGSTVWNGVPFVFPAERLVDHVDKST